MKLFVETDYFRKMNVGFALDEGYASTSEDFLVFNGQRAGYRKYSTVHVYTLLWEIVKLLDLYHQQWLASALPSPVV